MCRIIDQLANEIDIKPAEANYIFVGITAILIQKIPVLQQVLEDIFEEEDDARLNEHMDKMARIIQQEQWNEKFKHCIMPCQKHIVKPCGGGELF